jgi:hypothetical protein
MEGFSSTLSAEEWQRQLQAEQRLAAMDLLEDMALLAQEGPCEATRKAMTNRYRNLIGVSPVHRGEFRSGLERIKAGGGMSPVDLAELIGRDPQKNGSGFRTGSFSFSAVTREISTGVP